MCGPFPNLIQHILSIDYIIIRYVCQHWFIDPAHKSHNAPASYPTMHHFVAEMCTCVHISVTKWCTLGYLSDALWDLLVGHGWDTEEALQWCHNEHHRVSNHQPHEWIYSGTDQRKHQSSASLAFMWGIYQWPLNSPHKGPVTRKMFPFDDLIMENLTFAVQNFLRKYMIIFAL